MENLDVTRSYIQKDNPPPGRYTLQIQKLFAIGLSWVCSVRVCYNFVLALQIENKVRTNN